MSYRGRQNPSDARSINALKRLLDEQGVERTCSLLAMALERVGGEERPLASAAAAAMKEAARRVQQVSDHAAS